MTGLQILGLWESATCDYNKAKIDNSPCYCISLWITIDISTFWRVAPQSMKDSNLHQVRLRGRTPSWGVGYVRNCAVFYFLVFSFICWIYSLLCSTFIWFQMSYFVVIRTAFSVKVVHTVQYCSHDSPIYMVDLAGVVRTTVILSKLLQMAYCQAWKWKGLLLLQQRQP